MRSSESIDGAVPVSVRAFLGGVHERASMSIAVAALLDQARRALPADVAEAERCLARARTLVGSGQMGKALEGDGRQHALKPWQVGRVNRFVEERLDSNLRVEELAAAAHLSRSHFSRAFRSTLGETPIDYLRRRRVERAQHLIVTTTRSLAQIALDCGLADQCHLTRVFRQLTGTTPGAWRRTLRASEWLGREGSAQRNPRATDVDTARTEQRRARTHKVADARAATVTT